IERPGRAIAQRHEPGLCEIAGGPKRFQVEVVDGLDLVAEEIDTRWITAAFAGAGRPEIHDVAADGEVAGILDAIEACVAMIRQAALRTPDTAAPSSRDGKSSIDRRHHPLHRGAR